MVRARENACIWYCITSLKRRKGLYEDTSLAESNTNAATFILFSETHLHVVCRAVGNCKSVAEAPFKVLLCSANLCHINTSINSIQLPSC